MIINSADEKINEAQNEKHTIPERSRNMTVYIDIFFAVNFIIDYIILTLSCRKCRSFTANRLIASLFGAAYACMGLWDVPGFFFSFGAKITVLFMMCALSLFPCSIKIIAKACVKCFALSLLFSGSALTLMTAAGISYCSPLPDFLLAAAIAAGGTCFKYLEKNFMRKSDGFCLSIFYNGKKITLGGKCDTGNSLKSFGGLPVVVADFSSIKRLFPKITSPTQLFEFVEPADFRVIPYSTISDSGILYGFIPNRLTDEKNNKLNAVIAIAPIKLEAPLLYSPELLS